MELKETFQQVKKASKTLDLLTDEQRNEVLKAVADAIIAETPALLKANAEDLAKMDKANPLYDRLQLTEQRLQDIASDMRHVSTLPSPLGRVLKDKTLENGLHLQRVAVPFGVIGMIYEARPNVTYDVFSLCFKSGNACVLKGGKDANASNSAGVELIHRVLITFGIDPNVVTLLPATHEATGEMLWAILTSAFLVEERSSSTSSVILPKFRLSKPEPVWYIVTSTRMATWRWASASSPMPSAEE